MQCVILQLSPNMSLHWMDPHFLYIFTHDLRCEDVPNILIIKTPHFIAYQPLDLRIRCHFDTDYWCIEV